MSKDGTPPDRSSRHDTTSLRVAQAVDGDTDSLDWVVAHFQPLVESHVRFRLGATLASHADVQDLAQEVWFVAIQKMRQLESRDGRYGPVLVGFLATTATFLCNNFLRKRLRRGSHHAAPRSDEGSSTQSQTLGDLTDGIVTRVARAEVSQKIREGLARLPRAEQEILVLRLLEQKPLKRIAAALDLAPTSVGALYRRALVSLRQELPKSAYDCIRSCTSRRSQ